MSTIPHTLSEINRLPHAEKWAIYQRLVPPWVPDWVGLSAAAWQEASNPHLRLRCPEGSRAMELGIYYRANDADPSLYLHMADTFNYQLMVLLVVISDPEGPRFNIDIDREGNPTHFGTHHRHREEELRAMQAGLAPGQVRRGLRSFKTLLPLFESFVAAMGHDMFLIEPLAYHNALIFERYGFAYTYGRREMEKIHEGFLPGGALHRCLDGVSPFRPPEAWQTVRGRAWAIHDGILGHPFTGFHLYKRIGVHAGVNTFPDSQW